LYPKYFEIEWSEAKKNSDWDIGIRLKDGSLIRTDECEDYSDDYIRFFYKDVPIAVIPLDSIESVYTTTRYMAKKTIEVR